MPTIRLQTFIDASIQEISYGKGKIEIWYSIEKDEVELFENGNRVTEIDFSKYFMFN